MSDDIDPKGEKRKAFRENGLMTPESQKRLSEEQSEEGEVQEPRTNPGYVMTPLPRSPEPEPLGPLPPVGRAKENSKNLLQKPFESFLKSLPEILPPTSLAGEDPREKETVVQNPLIAGKTAVPCLEDDAIPTSRIRRVNEDECFSAGGKVSDPGDVEHGSGESEITRAASDHVSSHGAFGRRSENSDSESGFSLPSIDASLSFDPSRLMQHSSELEDISQLAASEVMDLLRTGEEADEETTVWNEKNPSSLNQSGSHDLAIGEDLQKNRNWRELGARVSSISDSLAAASKLKRMTPRPGSDVIAGRYRIVERIGVGGMARIFKVIHVDLGKAFALKIIHNALSEDPKMREMFFREARVASSLEHPNIVLITDFGEDDEYGAFIVMEYLQGYTLHSRLKKDGRLRVNLACEVVLQMAEALHFIHSREIVHCDIKSENIFLCEPPPEQRRRIIVKLLDFGLSRTKQAGGHISLSEVGGTPEYMAPEKIRRKPPSPSMDIYSLGILFYEMVTGALPFSGDMEEVLMAHLNKMPPPPSTKIETPLDERVDEIIMKALEKDPNDRQKDMGALVFELRTLMDMLGIGRRRRGGGSAGRMQKKNQHARNCQTVFDTVPVPLFSLDKEGRILLANQAFLTFNNAEAETLLHSRIEDTRLAKVCPEVIEDFRQTTEEKKRAQRILTYPDKTRSKEVSIMIWIIPNNNPDDPTAVIGVIHPFSA